MLRRLLARRPSHGTIVAYIALFVALPGGVAYAAATVGSAQVIDNSLHSNDLEDNAAVRSQDVVNDSVTGGGLASADIRANALTGSDISETSLAKVPNSDKLDGLDSAALSRSATYLVTARSKLHAEDWGTPAGTCDANETCSLQVSCDPGDRIDWGGYYEATPGTHVRGNYGETGPPTWNVDYHNDATTDDDLHVRALCVDQAAPFRP